MNALCSLIQPSWPSKQRLGFTLYFCLLQSLVEIRYPWILSLAFGQEPCLRHMSSWYCIFCWDRVPNACAGMAVSALPTHLFSYLQDQTSVLSCLQESQILFWSYSDVSLLPPRLNFVSFPPYKNRKFTTITTKIKLQSFQDWLLLNVLCLFLGRHEQLPIHRSSGTNNRPRKLLHPSKRALVNQWVYWN